MPDPIPQAGQIGTAATTDVANWPFEQRLKVTLERAKLGSEVRAQLQALISAESLGIMAGVLVAWLVSHAVGIGEVIDIILAAVGAVAIGFSFFTGLDHLYLFATGAYNARSLPALDAAADHFAKAVGILGVQAVLAVLFRGRPYARRETPSPPMAPPKTPGWRYRPTLTWTKKFAAGEGETSSWGDITVSSKGSAINSRLVALYHEQVHRWFTPKLYPMRHFRVECLTGSYVNSSLWRYFEEMLAEGIAKGRVYGFVEFFDGFSFPVENGYVYLLRAGADPKRFRGLAGRGLIPEAAGLLVSGPVVMTIPVELWHSPAAPSQ
jgi:hypothetical protein